MLICELEQIPKYKIYCDMDGVLVDLHRGARRITGDPVFDIDDSQTIKIFWKTIMQMTTNEVVDAWKDLPWVPGGKKLWDYIGRFNAAILSSPGTNKRAGDIAAGKKAWIQDHLSPQPSKMIFDPQKFKFADQNSILIDDKEKNIRPWIEHGGIGILHPTNSPDTESIIKKLQEEYGFPL